MHPGAEPIDLDLRVGEVVGITGLLGSGKNRLLRQLVGADRPVSGTFSIDGRDHRPRHPADAIAAGIGFVPEDRRTGAEIPGWDIASHVTLPELRRYRRAGLLFPRRERQAAASVVFDELPRRIGTTCTQVDGLDDFDSGLLRPAHGEASAMRSVE